MVPIQPKGWIDIVDLTITRPRPEPKPKSKTGPQRVPTAPRPDVNEVWVRQKAQSKEDSPDLLRRASKLAQDIGDTAQEYVKTGYDGSAQVASEALRMAQAAGENAPWLAGEAVRMASEAAGRFWETATWAVRRSPSEISEESDDKITILTMMGFGHEAAEASLKRCSSIEAAVEYIMENATLKGGSARDHPVLPLQAAGKTFTRDTSTLSEQPGQGRRRSQTVQADLMRCGYSEAQAKAAARRCSSIEAAVEWIAQHPDVVT